ncbi:hypothetical protein [Novosphingobium cyanobacteriorum]|uniref:Spore coat protein U domain-containing protein n=1 Tax=Novosphingobium cyanobacteriorum TaxID=3024215 RepID=A0ABT6CMG3_9SPHN|nr:hypothetical protein [Novosphingobium cyanobacteriorum]MDF8335052.1 hypothetical protein [Novosphingobium cyanobacteriorum]
MPSAALADTIAIPARGTVVPACRIFNSGNFPTLNIGTPGAGSAQATVHCNTPFVVRVQSTRGQLQNLSPAQQGTTPVLPYNLAVQLPLDSGSSVSATCSSASLRSGQSSCALSPAGAGLSTGASPAWNRNMAMTITWGASATPLMTSGRYVDRLVVTLGAQP